MAHDQSETHESSQETTELKMVFMELLASFYMGSKEAASLFLCSKYKKCIGLHIVNLYQIMSVLKFKINVIRFYRPSAVISG